MSDDVPPGQQCTMPGCERRARNPQRTASVCSTCAPDSEGDESAKTENTGERNHEEPDSSGATPTPEPAETGNESPPNGRDALDDAIQWFHARLDDQIPDHTDSGQHPDRPDTAREWFEEVRGFDADTIADKRLGWVPADATDRLVRFLRARGHDREDMLATGLFTEDLRLLWRGRYVFPYFDREGRVAYAIGRCTGGLGGGAADYDGHPEDFLAGKYAKLAHTKDYVTVTEPIYGLGTLERDGPVLITEGVADAIRAHEAGYACLSPVTTQFKHEHREALAAELVDADRSVYVVQDAERPPTDVVDDETGWNALEVNQYGPGLKGGVRTAAFLRDAGVDAYLAELPRLGLDKVDLDDYLGQWASDLSGVLASAKPASEHPAHDTKEGRVAGTASDDSRDKSGTGDSADYDGLSRDQVETALEHVSKTLSYDEWIRLGYAVHDWDDTHIGKSVFEDWSKSSPKWEEPTSPRAIEWIWQNATAGGKTTVATLVYHAKKGGWEPPRRTTDGDNYETDPRDVDVVTDPRRAWEAAGRVTPEECDDLPLPVADDGERWVAPNDETVDVVRAVAVVECDVDADATVDTDTYDRAYRLARKEYGAPLPEYVSADDAADRYEVVVGAVRELDFFDLDADALDAIVTDADGDGYDLAAYIDPGPVDGWRDSESGESVLVFESGVVWDADTETTIDPLRLVALDVGIIDDPRDDLEGEEFEHAYRAARAYGAPLPRWDIGTPESTDVVLPPAEELVEADRLEDTRDGVDAARDDVERLYRQLVRSGGDVVSVLRALPGLGKTTSAIKTAAGAGHGDAVPTAYLAPRKELMQQAAAKAKEYGGAWAYLPVFGSSVTEEAVAEAVAAVREEGKDLLRNRWELMDRVDAPVFPEEGDETDADEVDLDRATCDCADGEHTEAWALAVHVARELDYTPRDVHERAEALFGGPLPCQEEGETDDCEYSRGWDRIADADAPLDVVIGSYGHAHVESARTYYDRDEDGGIDRSERAVVLDEYPGGAFRDVFGPEFVDHAVWLASALREDVDDRQDLLGADLWGDDWVRAWLRGDGDEHVGAAVDAAEGCAGLLAARETAADVLAGYEERLETVGIADALDAVASAGVGLDAGTARRLVADLRDGCDDLRGTSGGRLAAWILDDVVEPLATYHGADPVDALPEYVGGDLERMVVDARDAAVAGADGAEGLLRAAATALRGGENGARELAVHADDGYAHRDAHRLLEGLIAPSGEEGVAEVIETEQFQYGDGDDGARLKRVRVGRDDGAADTVLVDRDHNGATLQSPPSVVAGNGEECPVVGLDATARRALWSHALGRDVELADIHNSPGERARFLRDELGLQVVRAGQKARFYEGDPAGKDLDGDVGLLQQIREEFAGAYAGGRDAGGVTVGKPAAITTKGVRDVLESDDRLDGVVSNWDNYGNITGDNDLGQHRLAAVLGTQHYGQHRVEHLAALEGEEVTATGRGAALDYGSDVANAYLRHMSHDQTMQAILRFTRGDTGAVVFARTGCLRDDLPVVGEGQVVNSWSPAAADVARSWRRFRGEEFTVGDVVDAVDVSRRHVRRILDEFAAAGYLEKHETGDGLSNRFEPVDDPGAAEVDLPETVNPDISRMGDTYTANVRVWGLETPRDTPDRPARSPLPAPTADATTDPPG